jgi:uncharacterized membrane protein
MNTNELADGLENVGMEQKHYDTMQQAATMLRQQQADYYSLLVNHDKLYAKVIEQQAEIEALNARIERMIENQSHHEGIAHAGGFEAGYQAAKAKTLTDKEINEIFSKTWLDLKDYKDFARAILRKAQEK